MNISDWLRTNLASSNNFARVGENKNLVFGCTLWNLWLHGNSITFSHSPGEFNNILAWTRALVAIVNVVSLSQSVLPNNGSIIIALDKWNPP
ncbi:hypothetical protein V6N13_123086 [Hibiscus sabdariffa]